MAVETVPISLDGTHRIYLIIFSHYLYGLPVCHFSSSCSALENPPTAGREPDGEGEFSHEDSNGKWLPRFLRMQILENSGKHPPNQRYPSSDGIYQRSFLSLPYIFLVTCPEWSIQGLDLIEMMERNLLVLLVEHIDWTEHYWNTLHWQLVIACIPMKVEVDVAKLCFEGGISLLIEKFCSNREKLLKRSLYERCFINQDRLKKKWINKLIGKC